MKTRLTHVILPSKGFVGTYLPHPHSFPLSPTALFLRMDVDQEGEAFWSKKCPCGKSFFQPNSFTNHIKSCTRYKRDVGATLENARARYSQKKKSKKGKDAIETWYAEEDLDIDQDLDVGIVEVGLISLLRPVTMLTLPLSEPPAPIYHQKTLPQLHHSWGAECGYTPHRRCTKIS
jgi:hypothetical protein